MRKTVRPLIDWPNERPHVEFMYARTFLSMGSLYLFSTLGACSPASSDVVGGGNGSGADSTGNGDDTDKSGSGTGEGSSDGEGTVSVDGTSTGDDDDPAICADYTAVSEPKVPVVFLLLDQSGSMKEPRWSHAKEAIATSSASLEQFADVGFIGFPTHPISSDQDLSQTCAAHVKVAPGGTSAEIAGSLHATAPNSGHTPVRAALDLVATELANPAYVDRPKYVVLITDGTPNCAPGQAAYVREDPTEAVTTMAANGIRTYVVGYDLSDVLSEGIVPSEVANNMAIAGGTESFRDVANGTELNAELEGIRQEVVPCDFELDEAPRGGPTYVRVTIDNVDYAYETEWTLTGEKTVTLADAGTACGVLRDGGQHDVNIQVECEPVQIR